jgi:hypothetical protein
MTFNLNNKTIQQLMKTKSLYSESKDKYNKETNESSTIRFYNNNEPFIVQVVDAGKIENEEFSGIRIYDGNNVLFCLIDTELIITSKLKSGNIIIINEIICLNLDDNPKDFKIAIAIHKCWNIGNSEFKIDLDNEITSKYKDLEQIHISQDTKEINQQVDEAKSIESKLFTHLIINLLPSISKYTIRVKLCNKTILNEFLTSSGLKRSKIRFQFADASSYIELSCFGEFAEKFESLMINKVYL